MFNAFFQWFLVIDLVKLNIQSVKDLMKFSTVPVDVKFTRLYFLSVVLLVFPFNKKIPFCRVSVNVHL